LDLRNIYSYLKYGNNLLISSDDGIYSIPDGKNVITSENAGLFNAQVRSFIICDSYLIAGTECGGVWRRPLSELGIENYPKINEILLFILFPQLIKYQSNLIPVWIIRILFFTFTIYKVN